MSRNRPHPEWAGGKTERIVPYKAWEKLRTGDIIVMRKSRIARRILRAGPRGFIELYKIKIDPRFPKCRTTLYCYGDRANFILPDHCNDSYSLEDFCPWIK